MFFAPSCCSLLLVVARCCLLLLTFGFQDVFPFAVRYFLLLFVARAVVVLEIESVLSQKPKQANAFGCSLSRFCCSFCFFVDVSI